MPPKLSCAHHFAAEHHGGQHGGHVAAEEVGAHAGHIAHVVAHVVGDGGGVARVILGDAGFHLAHEIGAHIGGLGVDATAHTGEERDALSTEGEAREHLEALHHLFAVGTPSVTYMPGTR
jgi:hypothetical protein